MVYGEFVESPQVQYATWLANHLPGEIDSVYFVNSGSEAVEGAIKLAKRATGRTEIVSFQRIYHGSTAAALVTGKMKNENVHSDLCPRQSDTSF